VGSEGQYTQKDAGLGLSSEFTFPRGEGRLRAVDRLAEKTRGQSQGFFHSVAAWSVENRVVLGCQSVDQKPNEITAIPELLMKLELKGAIITMDAMGSQIDIAAQIVDGGGDCVLAIKDNHPTLHKAMSEHFDQVHEEGCIEAGVRHHHTSDAKHGRRENRYYYQAAIPESLTELTDSWKGPKSVGQVHNSTIRDGKECSETRYYLSSLLVSLKNFVSAVRALWGIETSFHWVLDMVSTKTEVGFARATVRTILHCFDASRLTSLAWTLRKKALGRSENEQRGTKTIS